MDSQGIGSVASTGATAPAQPRAQGTKAAATDASGKAPATHHQQAADTKHAEPIPQRDPRSLQYQVDGATHRVVATIVDEGSKTVVRQIPDAEILRIAQAIDRMQGFLVEERA